MLPIEKQVFVCQGHRCIDDGDGGERLYHRLRKKLAQRGLLHDGNLSGNVRVTRMLCTAGCGNGPMMIVYPEGVFYGHVSFRDLDRIIDDHLIGNRIVEDLYFFRTEQAVPIAEPSLRPRWLGGEQAVRLQPEKGAARADEEGAMAVDPVCGMAVDPEAAEHVLLHASKNYYFCSPACKKSFGREPAIYLDPHYTPSM